MDYDAELRLLNQALRLAYGIERHDRVLDVGCGTGQTTREAARMAVEGSVLGIDLSAVAIDRARELARAKGIRNVTFLRADAQAYPFPSERFDLVVSRFGTMFFRDPVAAFANVGRALRRAGRLAMMVWQGHEQALTRGRRAARRRREVKGELPGQRWGDRGDSNPRPSGPQPDALTN